MRNILKNMDLMRETKKLIDLNIEKIKRGSYTYFLDHKKIDALIPILNQLHTIYHVFYPYEGATYGIIYTKELPITVLKITSKASLTHSEIMGSLYSLNLKNDIIGDIIISEYYYVVVMKHMVDYIKNNIYQIGYNNVEISIASLEDIVNYKQRYETKTITSSSERIDVIIAKIIGVSRTMVEEKFQKKEVILNYSILEKSSYHLRKDDIFSIRKFGKYKYIGIVSKTKKDKYIIEYQKYI